MKSKDQIVEHEKLTFLGKIIIPWAIKHRNNLVLKCIKNKEGALLDIGCGKGYLVRNSICKENIGIDEQACFRINKNMGVVAEEISEGVTVGNKLNYPDNKFDYVTLVAVLEHFKNPDQIIIDIYRILKENGLLIITTPFPIVEKIAFFLDRGSDQLRGSTIKEEHEQYFDLIALNNLVNNYFSLIKYNKFQLGVNQLFIYRKIS